MAENSVLIDENGNVFFYTTNRTLSNDCTNHRAGSQLKTLEKVGIPVPYTYKNENLVGHWDSDHKIHQNLNSENLNYKLHSLVIRSPRGSVKI